MTSSPQTKPRSLAALESRRRLPNPAPAAAGTSGAVRVRPRQALPAVDPSKEFGCVDWFLYPDTAPSEAQACALAG